MEVLCSAIGVEKRSANDVRRVLRDAGCLYPNARPLERDGLIYFPLRGRPPSGVHGVYCTMLFPLRKYQPRSYKEVLRGRIDSKKLSLLPSSFDVVGDIVLMKLPQDLIDISQTVAEAVMDANPRVRAVFLDCGVKGVERIRDIRLLAGNGDARTLHRENGIELWVDISSAYFSPRLAAERARAIDEINSGARVLDMFAGVGPFTVLAAKRKGAIVTAIDINPAAVSLLFKNAAKNGVSAGVEAFVADARVALECMHRKSIRYDNIIMNLPHGAYEFLEGAIKVLASDGTIHYYEILETDAVDLRIRDFEDMGLNLLRMRNVHPYSPTQSMMCFLLSHKEAKGRR